MTKSTIPNWTTSSWLNVVEKYAPEREILELLVRQILDSSIEKGNNILDIGASNGRFTLYAQNEIGAIVTPVDIEEEFVGFMKKKGVDACYGDVTNLHFNSDTFDFVICSMVLQIVPNYKKGIGEIARVLKRDGEGLIAVTHPILGVNNYSTEHLIEIRHGDGIFRNIHRPLCSYINTMYQNGLVVTNIIEPKNEIKGYPHHEYMLIELKKCTGETL